MAVIERQSKAFLNRREAAELLGIKEQTLASWAHCRRGPAFIKVGRSVRYKLADLEKYVSDARVTTNDQS